MPKKPTGRKPASRAKALPPTAPQSTEARVQHVMGMMRRLEWVTGESGPALAEQWGLSWHTLEGHACEASRRVCAEGIDRDSVLALTTSAMRRALARSDAKGDSRAVADLARTWAGVSGASAPTKIDATIREGEAMDYQMRDALKVELAACEERIRAAEKEAARGKKA